MPPRILRREFVSAPSIGTYWRTRKGATVYQRMPVEGSMTPRAATHRTFCPFLSTNRREQTGQPSHGIFEKATGSHHQTQTPPSNLSSTSEQASPHPVAAISAGHVFTTPPAVSISRGDMDGFDIGFAAGAASYHISQCLSTAWAEDAKIPTHRSCSSQMSWTPGSSPTDSASSHLYPYLKLINHQISPTRCRGSVGRGGTSFLNSLGSFRNQDVSCMLTSFLDTRHPQSSKKRTSLSPRAKPKDLTQPNNDSDQETRLPRDKGVLEYSRQSSPLVVQLGVAPLTGILP
ncbi:hypothetical protein QBC39DRAFT_25526 [Podospora conica]|nr:hypothetical protein QBC39DRAFT_25526 [Schizothecium conicum]